MRGFYEKEVNASLSVTATSSLAIGRLILGAFTNLIERSIINMITIQKFLFTAKELKTLQKTLGNEIQIAIDIRTHIIAIGDCQPLGLKYALYEKKSKRGDIHGISLNLTTGEINYSSPINNPLDINPHDSLSVPTHIHEDIFREISYFFFELEVFRIARLNKHKKPIHWQK